MSGFLGEHGWVPAAPRRDGRSASEPKLGPYRDRMRERLGGAVGLPAFQVNVKFTTNEGMGFVGRGEGLAAMAVATVERAD